MGAEIEENINKIIRNINSLGFKHRLTDEQFRHVRKARDELSLICESE